MAITDDNPQNKLIQESFVDNGNSGQEFTRTYVFDESGDFDRFFDLDFDGNTYTPVGPIAKANAGTTTLNLGDLETVTTLVDNLDGTATYTNEDGTQVTITLGGGGGGVTDHGALTGLGDDDHPQYRQRSFHLGTQLASTISNFAATVRSTVLTGLATTSTAAVVAADTVLQAIGKLQARTALLFYSEFTKNEVGLLNATTTETDFLTLNATTPVAGNYRIDWAYSWSGNDGAQDCIVRLYSGTTLLWEQRQEPKDTAGTGITVPNTTGGNTNSGTNQRHLVSTFDILNLPAGANDFRITLDSSGNGDNNTVYKGVIAIKKEGLN